MADRLDEIEARLAVAVLLAAISWRDDKIGYYGRGHQGNTLTERALLAAVAEWKRAKGGDAHADQLRPIDTAGCS